MEQEQPRTVERVDDAPVVAASPGISRIRGLLSELELNPGNEGAAASFNRAVGVLAKQRSAEVFEFLRELVDLPVLRQAKDPGGFPCRAAVLAAWVDLGYPWALELPPEDHAWLRAQSPASGAGWLSVTFVFAVISALLNVGLVLLFFAELLTASRSMWAEALFVTPFVGMGAHAIATIAATQAGLRAGASAAGRLRVLGRGGLIAPAVALVVAGMSVEMGLCVMILCLPFTASAFTAWGASRALLQERR